MKPYYHPRGVGGSSSKQESAGYMENVAYLPANMAPLYGTREPESGRLEGKKKRHTVKRQNIHHHHRRIPSANVPYQAISNQTLTRLNRLIPRAGKYLVSSQPQLLISSQIQYLPIASTVGRKQRLPAPSLYEMLGEGGIQSQRSAFQKPPVVTKSAVFSSESIIPTQFASTSNLRSGGGGLCDHFIGSTMEVPMPSKVRQSVIDTDEKEDLREEENKFQFTAVVTKQSRNPNVRTGPSSSTQASSYDHPRPQMRKPLIPIRSTELPDQNVLECEESIMEEPAERGHVSLSSDDGRLSIPSEKSRSYHLPPSNALHAFRVNQPSSPPQVVAEPEEIEEPAARFDSPFVSAVDESLVLPPPLMIEEQEVDPDQDQENKQPQPTFKAKPDESNRRAGAGDNALVDAEVINFWIQREAEYQADPLYLEQQPELTNDMRSILLDWMIEVHSEFRSKRETLATSINIVDRFLTYTEDEIQKSEFQLIGCTAMFIAAKMEEVLSPKIGDYVLSTENGYTEAQIRDMEMNMLTTLNWLISPITYAHWANWYSKEWDDFITQNFYAHGHPALEAVRHKVQSVQLHTADSESYEVYREFMQIMDALQMDVHSLQYSTRAVIAAVLYLVLGENLKQLSHAQITKEMPYSSQLVLAPALPWNDLYEHFLVTKFGFTLRELLPTVQYVARFFDLPMDFSIPGVKPEGPYEEFLAFQTHNPNGLEFVRSLLN